MSGQNNRKQVTKKRVYFNLNAPEAQDVQVCGDFNDWETDSRRLRKNKKGVWSTFMMLPLGTYEYRFLVDGEWQNDPGAETVPNSFGSVNSVRTVI